MVGGSTSDLHTSRKLLSSAPRQLGSVAPSAFAMIATTETLSRAAFLRQVAASWPLVHGGVADRALLGSHSIASPRLDAQNAAFCR